MPDKHGFDHLPNRGNITLRCIWCPQEFAPATSETKLAQHARRHAKDRLESLEASKREVTLAGHAVSE